jgi:hypothetical protein
MQEGKSRREVMKSIKFRELTHEEMEPLRKAYDYESMWLNKLYDPDVDDETIQRLRGYGRGLQRYIRQEKPAGLTPEAVAKVTELPVATVQADFKRLGLEAAVPPQAFLDTADHYVSMVRMTHCRPHMYAVMEGLKGEFPALWKQGRLGMVPVGDVFLALDKKMKAGEVPGIVNVGQYSADGGHLRSGLPRYTLAATYYAVLFRESPGAVDWKVFQDRSNYESGKYGFYVHQPDLAVHLDITEERAKIVNDTIWGVVKDHPYTAITLPQD